MTALLPRLVFGCARLPGGFSARASRGVVEQALAGGIERFDTAPSYGLGTAEQMIGDVVGNDPRIAITAKVGSHRPRHALALTALRRLRRVLPRSSTGAEYTPAFPGEAPAPGGCFDPAFMERSLATSLANLRRGAVSHLLLHECHAASAAEVVDFLKAQVAQGRASHVGLANSSIYDPALHRACPPGWTMQAAIDPAMLLQPCELAGPAILHSLVKTDQWLRRRDGRYAAAADEALAGFVSLAEPGAMAIALPYCLATAHVPEAGLIYATSERARLQAMLGAVAAIDAGPGAGAIAAAFRRAYARQ